MEPSIVTMRVLLLLLRMLLGLCLCLCLCLRLPGASAERYFVGSTQLTPSEEDWASHQFVFVGGDHNTGTSVTERLISSQPYAAQLRVEQTSNVSHMEHCHRHRTPTSCAAPENEGIFVTDVFVNMYKARNTECKPRPPSSWGMCARKQQVTEMDIGDNATSIRQVLYADWVQFWNTSRPYLVEKDISNTVKSRFYTELFGVNRTAFVFVLRHPLASCKDFKCVVHTHIKSWIDTYTILNEDLDIIEKKNAPFIVFHLEKLVTNTETVVSELTHLLGFPSMSYLNGKGEVVHHHANNSGAVLRVSDAKSRRRLGYHKDTSHPDAGSEMSLRQAMILVISCGVGS
jgi:hypothetical protein